MVMTILTQSLDKTMNPLIIIQAIGVTVVVCLFLLILPFIGAIAIAGIIFWLVYVALHEHHEEKQKGKSNQ